MRRKNIIDNNGQITEHTVKEGESLWRIARRFDIHVVDLLEWNNLKRGNHLQPGQILIVQMNQTGA